jgi:hypothetical protein
MDERKWMTCADSERMLQYIHDRMSERKLRLFACACCRRVWHLLEDKRSRNAVEVHEQHADGLAEQRQRERAVVGARQVWRELAESDANDSPRRAALAACLPFALKDFTGKGREMPKWRWLPGAALIAIECGLPPAPSDLLRDLVGNPFRLATLDPAYQTSTVLSLAQAAYDHRILPAGMLGPARLAVLGDALEDAGCDNAAILEHLRSAGPHVRGCFAVDLLLGKR